MDIYSWWYAVLSIVLFLGGGMLTTFKGYWFAPILFIGIFLIFNILVAEIVNTGNNDNALSFFPMLFVILSLGTMIVSREKYKASEKLKIKHAIRDKEIEVK